MSSMDHRIAERRRQVTEERATGRLRWLIRMLALVGLLAAGVWLVGSPMLSIRSVVVTGAERSDPMAVADRIGVGPGTPTISVRGGAIEAALLKSPWIAEADVTVSWPGSVEIHVRERVPIASVAFDVDVFDVAVDGVLVARADGDSDPPTIRSDSTRTAREGDRITDAGTLGALEFVAGLSPSLRRATTITISGGVVEAVVVGHEVALGRPTDMAFKAATVEAIVATGLGAGGRIDVTAPTRPALALPQSQLEGEPEALEQSQPLD